ncbi:uncharacterized protein PRCAT00001645001 [Priceomyces carsonii]|uniref:uncharacterized protein n=1 Tax=Priceomyces carsonii TaxID=28549 RepID=UPI002ED86B07|nr:unnamed protein product [Priceomyces carsonii]
MISIDLRLHEWQWQYQISSTFFVFVIVPLLCYLYAKYLTSRPNRYNKIEEPIKIAIPIPDEAKPHWKGKRLYPPNLSIKVPNEPTKIQSYCPATGQYLGTFNATSREEMSRQVERAKEAQASWRKSDFTLRRKLLKTLGRYLIDHQDDIARVACRDSGKTRIDALMGEIMVTLEKINWIIAHGEKILRPSKRPGPSHLLVGLLKNGEVRYEPIGVVAALVSWNYPFHNLVGPVVAAIFTGNAIIVKCSEQVLWSSKWFVELLRTILKLLNINQNLIQLTCCYPEDADFFTSNPGISHITFIGSKQVAHRVVLSAAKELTPCVVELGGKDTVIVLNDVKNLERLSSIIMRGTFQSAGQNCIGIERVICLPKVYDELLRILVDRVKILRLGSDIDQLDEIDVGAMISGNRFNHLEELISDAVEKGARLLCGGSPFQHPNYPQGHYFEPTVVADVTPAMRIFQEEVFGPVLTMIKAKDAAHAVKLANLTEYGLGSSIFGKDFEQINELANQLECGNVAINDFATFYVAQLPFGGTKKSGYGKFGGEEGLTSLCVAKSVVMDKPLFRMLGVATSIPPQLDYPIKNDKVAWSFLKSLNKAGYDDRIWEVLKAFKKLVTKETQK